MKLKNTIVFALMLSFLVAIQLNAGVTKKSKTEVEFRGFGVYKISQAEKINPDMKWADSESDFKGSGLMGKIAGKFLKTGNNSEWIDLNTELVTQLEHKKKQYRQNKIEPLKMDEAGESGEEKEQDEPKTREESDIRIIRNEVRVEQTGAKKTINNFNTEQFLVFWIVEWENVNTKERGKDSLITDIWSTSENPELFAKVSEEETAFQKAYLAKLGIEMDEMTRDILGLKWKSMLNAFQPQNQNNNESGIANLDELEKIKGFPVVVEGKFYNIRPQSQVAGDEPQKQVEEEEETKDLKGMFGGFAKKALKKEKKPEEKKDEFSFRYRTEVVEINLTDLSSNDFAIPANYKKVD